MKWHMVPGGCIPISGLRYSFQSRLLQNSNLPLPSSSQSTHINLHLQTHTYSHHSFYNPKCLAPWSLPPSTLPFQTASSFSITAESPFNTVDLPLGQVLDSCLLSSATLYKHAEIENKHGVSSPYMLVLNPVPWAQLVLCKALGCQVVLCLVTCSMRSPFLFPSL